MGRLASVARCRANRYEVVRGLWKGVAIPSIMYGLETFVWPKKDMDRLEVSQNKVGRVALGANRYAAVEAIRGDMGWSTFKERIGKAVLRYTVRLLRMDANRWARKVHEWNVEGKWMRDSVRMQIWAEVGLIGVARGEASMKRCKGLIDKCVEKKGLEEWLRGVREKVTLVWYRGKDQPRYERLYDGSFGGELLFKARTKSLEVNSRVYRWENDGSKLCIMCRVGEDETVEHLMLECERYEYERQRMLETVVEEIGVDRWNEVKERSVNDQMKYLLGLSGEWKSESGVGECVKDFLVCAWMSRKSMNERMRV